MVSKQLENLVALVTTEVQAHDAKELLMALPTDTFEKLRQAMQDLTLGD